MFKVTKDSLYTREKELKRVKRIEKPQTSPQTIKKKYKKYSNRPIQTTTRCTADPSGHPMIKVVLWPLSSNASGRSTCPDLPGHAGLHRCTHDWNAGRNLDRRASAGLHPWPGWQTEHILHDVGIPIVKIDRGGPVTYHGPGRLESICLNATEVLKVDEVLLWWD